MGKIVVLGAGMMGSAFCVPLVDSGHRIRLVGTHLDEEIVSALKRGDVHPKLKAELPSGIEAFSHTELERAMDGVDAVVLGVSSQGVTWAARALSAFALRELPVIMISKGLVWNENKFEILPDTFVRALPSQIRGGVNPVAVAGPCIAGELVRRVETCVVFTGRDFAMCERSAGLFNAAYYHVRLSRDVMGVEICAALKNAYAMGVGFAAGIHEQGGGVPGSVAMHNYEAGVFAQAIVEMQHFIKLISGDPQSAVWLPGVGDLNVTCNGGRTGRFGKLLGLGLSLEEAIARMEGATLECLEILAVVRDGLQKLDDLRVTRPDELPLVRHLAQVAAGERRVEMPFSSFFRE